MSHADYGARTWEFRDNLWEPTLNIQKDYDDEECWGFVNNPHSIIGNKNSFLIASLKGSASVFWNKNLVAKTFRQSNIDFKHECYRAVVESDEMYQLTYMYVKNGDKEFLSVCGPLVDYIDDDVLFTFAKKII